MDKFNSFITIEIIHTFSAENKISQRKQIVDKYHIISRIMGRLRIMGTCETLLDTCKKLNDTYRNNKHFKHCYPSIRDDYGDYTVFCENSFIPLDDLLLLIHENERTIFDKYGILPYTN